MFVLADLIQVICGYATYKLEEVARSICWSSSEEPEPNQPAMVNVWQKRNRPKGKGEVVQLMKGERELG